MYVMSSSVYIFLWPVTKKSITNGDSLFGLLLFFLYSKSSDEILNLSNVLIEKKIQVTN